MTIGAILPYFGGKRSLAPAIVEALGPHRQYFEPFCGSLAVLLAKPPAAQETVCDLHGDATNLAWVLQDADMAERLYDRVQRTVFAERLIRYCWRHLAEPCGDAVDPERAYRYFVVSWAARNGMAGTTRRRGAGLSLALRFTAGGGSPTVRFRSATESIPSWHERLRNVVILRRDAFSLFARYPDVDGLAIYADPPYHPISRTGWTSSGANSRYEHEFDHDGCMGVGDDHERLRDVLAEFRRARVVVSYYDCDRVRELYAGDGWEFVDFRRRKGLGAGEAPEVLIVNRRVSQ